MALDDMVANAKSQEAHGGYYFGKHELLETIKDSKKMSLESKKKIFRERILKYLTHILTNVIKFLFIIILIIRL